jgi:hypothetical protein
MDDKAGDLRRHAAHCRFMARSALTGRTRTILSTMASEFDDQADAMAALKPIVPEV